jgi:hypothetical protein
MRVATRQFSETLVPLSRVVTPELGPEAGDGTLRREKKFTLSGAATPLPFKIKTKQSPLRSFPPSLLPVTPIFEPPWTVGPPYRGSAKATSERPSSYSIRATQHPHVPYSQWFSTLFP